MKNQNSDRMNIEALELSKENIALNFRSKYIDLKSSYILSALFILFTIVNGIKIADNYNRSSKIPEQIEKLKIQSSLPPTIIQTKSILKKLHKTEEKQKKIRDLLVYIFKLKKQNGNLQSMNLKNGVLQLKYRDGNLQRLKYYIEKKEKVVKSYTQKGIIIIEVKI